MSKSNSSTSSELEAKRQLDDFNDWYDNNGLEALLSERLAAKEVKKEAKMKKDKISKTANIKKEKGSKGKRPQLVAAPPVYRGPVPRMHLWPTIPTTPGAQFDKNAEYETPTMRRPIPNFFLQETPTGPPLDAPLAIALGDDKLTTPLKAGEMEDENSSKKLPDSAKLKGVFWPGMNLFDSATLEMKRMRNQRKDGSILQQMMASSAEVEPTEVSYNPDGEFRNSRNIFGPLSTENSPTKLEAPTPKRRKTRKSVLKDISVNIPPLRAPVAHMESSSSSPDKRLTMQSRVEIGQLARQDVPMLNQLSRLGVRYAPSTEEEEEFRMTVGDMGKKRGFNIFQDVPEHSPGRTESPLEDLLLHRFEFSNNGLPHYSSNSEVPNQLSPTPVPKMLPMRISGKENGQPEIYAPRPGPNCHGLPSQFFFDPTLNPLYIQAQPPSYPYGDPQPLQPSYGDDVKPMMSSFQGNFRPVGSVFRPGGIQGSHGHVANSGANSGNGFQYRM